MLFYSENNSPVVTDFSPLFSAGCLATSWICFKSHKCRGSRVCVCVFVCVCVCLQQNESAIDGILTYLNVLIWFSRIHKFKFTLF